MPAMDPFSKKTQYQVQEANIRRFAPIKIQTIRYRICHSAKRIAVNNTGYSIAK
jgi:hypothetical protein